MVIDKVNEKCWLLLCFTGHHKKESIINTLSDLVKGVTVRELTKCKWLSDECHWSTLTMMMRVTCLSLWLCTLPLYRTCRSIIVSELNWRSFDSVSKTRMVRTYDREFNKVAINVNFRIFDDRKSSSKKLVKMFQSIINKNDVYKNFFTVSNLSHCCLGQSD